MKTLKKFLAIALAVIMALGVMSVSAFAEDVVADETITYVDITVSEPVDGEYANGDYALDGVESSLFFIQWVNNATGDVLYASDLTVETVDVPFEDGTSYTACITLAANDGYVFDSAENLTVLVNGNEAQIADLSDDAKELSFTCSFDCVAEDVDGGDEGGFDFSQLLDLLKTVLLTFVRFLGSLIGLS